MNDRHSQRLKQFQQLKAAFDQFQSAWTTNVSLSADISVFKLNLSGIESQAVLHEVNLSGISKTKQTLRAQLSVQALQAATAVSTFAYNTKNELLAAKVSFTKSSLSKNKEAELVSACQIIFEQATEHVAALADYGVDAGSLAELQTTLVSYRDLTPQPKTALLSGKEVTKGLADLFRDTSTLVKKSIDGKLLQYQKKAPAFHAAYTNARAVGRIVSKLKKEVAKAALPTPSQPVF
jgi:hypothetical protein